MYGEWQYLENFRPYFTRETIFVTSTHQSSEKGVLLLEERICPKGVGRGQISTLKGKNLPLKRKQIVFF